MVVILVDHAFHDVAIVVVLERAVVILYQQDETAELRVVVLLYALLLQTGSTPVLLLLLLLSSVFFHLGCQILLDTLQKGLLFGGTYHCVVGHVTGRRETAVGQLGIDIVATLVFHYAVAVGSCLEVQILIAHKAQRDAAAIGLAHLLTARVGGNSHSGTCIQQCYQQK